MLSELLIWITIRCSAVHQHINNTQTPSDETELSKTLWWVIIICKLCTGWEKVNMHSYCWSVLSPGHLSHSSSSKKKKKKLGQDATRFLKRSVNVPQAGLCWVNPEPKGQMRCWRGLPSCARPCVKSFDWACHEVVPLTRDAAAISTFPRVPWSGGGRTCAVAVLSLIPTFRNSFSDQRDGQTYWQKRQNIL